MKVTRLQALLSEEGALYKSSEKRGRRETTTVMKIFYHFERISAVSLIKARAVFLRSLLRPGERKEGQVQVKSPL